MGHLVSGIILIAILLLATVFWLWMLGDCVRNKSLSSIQKIVWFLVIFFTHILGALAYFLFGRSKRNYQSVGQTIPPTATP